MGAGWWRAGGWVSGILVELGARGRGVGWDGRTVVVARVWSGIELVGRGVGLR